LRALIYINLRGLNSLSDLIADIHHNTSIALRCVFDILKPLPSIERFSRFLEQIPNGLIQDIRLDLVDRLIQANQIKSKYLSLDSCPIPARVRENNLKTNVKDRFLKGKLIKGDPDAGLGVIVHYLRHNKKEIQYF
jgi:hypothetical protein